MNNIFVAVDGFFKSINGYAESLLFFDIFFGQVEGASFPFVVALLIVGGVYLTLKMGFVNLRMFSHALAIVRGKYKTKMIKGLSLLFSHWLQHFRLR